MTDVNWSDPKQAGKQLEGNWQNFRSFYWFQDGRPAEAEKWTHIGLSNRDSGLIDTWNAKVIVRELGKADRAGRMWELQEHSSSLVGHVNVLIVRPFRTNGKPSAAWLKVCELKEKLQDYPILDEDGYYQWEYSECYSPDLDRLADELSEWAAEETGEDQVVTPDEFIAAVSDLGGWDEVSDEGYVMIDLGNAEPKTGDFRVDEQEKNRLIFGQVLLARQQEGEAQ